MTSAGCPAPVTRVLVIDTNVLVAGLITQEATGDQLLLGNPPDGHDVQTVAAGVERLSR